MLMKIIMELLLLALGFGMLVKGADWFVEGSSGIADRFGVPQLVIGLTIVAMGTSAPEAAVSITAALKGNAEITIGNIVGSVEVHQFPFTDPDYSGNHIRNCDPGRGKVYGAD